MNRVHGFVRMLDHSGLSPVQYFWESVEFRQSSSEKQDKQIQKTDLSSWMGKKIQLSYLGKIRCVHCGKITSKSFAQGSCYPCFTKLAQNDFCILKPDQCHYHLGTCREPDWGEKNCLQPTSIYLANSSGIKVGITKENPITNRWVDQGAVQGVLLATAPTRREAGIVETYLSQFLPDKTSWQKLLQGDPLPLDLAKEKNKFQKELQRAELEATNPKGKSAKIQLTFSEANPISIQYPVLEYPKKVKSISFDEKKSIISELLGIKGQYFLLADGVINIRSLGGYEMELSQV